MAGMQMLVLAPSCSQPTASSATVLLCKCYCLQVEATKFTELGFVGRDVDEIVKDLMEASLTLTKTRLAEALREVAEQAAEDIILAELIGSDTEKSIDTFRWALQWCHMLCVLACSCCASHELAAHGYWCAASQGHRVVATPIRMTRGRAAPALLMAAGTSIALGSWMVQSLSLIWTHWKSPSREATCPRLSRSKHFQP